MKKLSKIILTVCLLLTTQNLSAGGNGLVELTATNYLSVLIKSKKPVLVKFWAPWCKPCRKMTPEYKKAAKSFAGKVVFAELNIDKYNNVSKIYGVQGIPALILFKNNKIINRTKGSLKQKRIEAFVKSSL